MLNTIPRGVRMALKRVLVVDDEENIGKSLRLILEREGYAVSTCSSVAEAKAQSQRADAYLVDVQCSGFADPDDLWSRDHSRRGGGDARGRFRFSGKTAEPRKSPGVSEERARRHQAARGEPAIARDGGRGANDRRKRRVRSSVGSSHDGGPERRAGACRRRVRHWQGAASRAHP